MSDVKYKLTGRQLAAGRILAGLGTRELGVMSRTSAVTVTRLESMDVIETGDEYHSPVRRVTLDKIIGALSECGVRLCTEHRGVHLA